MKIFKAGDKIFINNKDLKTYNCRGVIIGKHPDDEPSDYFLNFLFKVKIEYEGTELEVIVNMNDMEHVPGNTECYKCGKPLVKIGNKFKWQEIYVCTDRTCDGAVLYAPPQIGTGSGTSDNTVKDAVIKYSVPRKADRTTYMCFIHDDIQQYIRKKLKANPYLSTFDIEELMSKRVGELEGFLNVDKTIELHNQLISNPTPKLIPESISDNKENTVNETNTIEEKPKKKTSFFSRFI